MNRKSMEYLFTYGTLQNETIQHSLFKRKLNGFADTLLGFELYQNKIYGSYPVVSKIENLEAFVKGMVYGLEEKELKIADAYEGEGYVRKRATLASGKMAWVYLERKS